ncbi:MAG TPA: hypothetical protein VIZ43_05900 [Trebonia sp.]
MTPHDEEGSLVMVVGYEGPDPARRALAAAARILRSRDGWIEVVYVEPTKEGDHDSSEPSAEVMDSVGSTGVGLHYEVRSVLEAEKQPWRLRSARGGG